MRRRLLASLSFVGTALALALDAHAAPSSEVSKGPYLQHLDASGVEIRVELTVSEGVSVDVFKDGRPDAQATRASLTVLSPPGTFHSMHVTGLVPATRYRYQVHAGGRALDGTFVTAPDGASHAPFTFIAFGDNRTDGPAHERVVRAIERENFDFLLHTGDFVNAGDNDAAWQSFFDIEEPLLRDHCLFACVGNHELVNDREAAHFERYFGPDDRAPAVPLYRSFRWGRARFFLLNAFIDWDHGPARAWLDDALSRADHEDGVDLRVAVLHHSPYASGPHGNNLPLLAARIDDLLVAHKVDLVLGGHDHIYERGETKGLKYIVTGGGGAPLYRDITPLASTRKVEATYNYVLTTVTDEAVTLLAKRPDGSVIEQCSFERGGPWACDAKKPKAVPDAAMPTGGIPELDPVRARCGCDVPGVPNAGNDGWVAILWALGGVVRRAKRSPRTAPPVRPCLTK